MSTCFSLEVKPKIPERLQRLEELANDLYYSWSPPVRSLFYNLHPKLWDLCGHNPKLFLRRVSQNRLEEALQDRSFMESYNLALTDYDTYLKEADNSAVAQWLDPSRDQIAYFSLEFGLHESLPTYSGGLGILAGDHCKAASDLSAPLVAVGLLYRHGYFTQRIDAYGNQKVHYTNNEFAHLPIEVVRNDRGEEQIVQLRIADRQVHLRIWHAKAGHIRLYLLDSDIPQNSEADRTITYQLYGGTTETRIQQEIVLGIGGVQALELLGYNPTVWHINEGHAAFLILERCRRYISPEMDLDAALELVAASTVFTTHTPVPAGHDIFDPHLFEKYFSRYAADLNCSLEQLLDLGASPSGQGGFNMTALAFRGSRHHNGVSKIHGEVASKMEGYIWPQIPYEENPVGHVTNGVHVLSFLAKEWRNLFDLEFGREWRNQLLNEDYWNCIDQIPNYRYWSVRHTLKSILVKEVKEKLVRQLKRNKASGVEIARHTQFLDNTASDSLVIGFARRFATYKRAALLFADPDRLARLLNNSEKPVLIIYAGKAHPSDLPGQQLIHTIHQISRRKEFEGKILLLEDYNLALARLLVGGVDVWLNTPEYPLEASGTSGQKAGLNGVVNLSVLDGWWAEGFTGDNGWGIMPHPSTDTTERNHLEGLTLLDILEHEVIPMYFDTNGHGYSEPWVNISKRSMKTTLPRFNSERMVMDYVRSYYASAAKQGAAFSINAGEAAKVLAAWKRKVHENWAQVSIRRLDEPVVEVESGEAVTIKVGVALGELSTSDVRVECIIGRINENDEFETKECLQFTPETQPTGAENIYTLQLQAKLAGMQFYKLRVYPYHDLLTHKFETGCMLWV
jgi:starch phosphorylase